MSLLLHELKDRLLQQYDANDLLEMLEITAEELLDNFQDRIEEQQSYLEDQLQEEQENGSESEV